LYSAEVFCTSPTSLAILYKTSRPQQRQGFSNLRKQYAFLWHTNCILVLEIITNIMKHNKFNICPSCIHKDTCVLTKHKSQVWACSEFDEIETADAFIKTGEQQIRTEPKLELAYS